MRLSFAGRDDTRDGRAMATTSPSWRRYSPTVKFAMCRPGCRQESDAGLSREQPRMMARTNVVLSVGHLLPPAAGSSRLPALVSLFKLQSRMMMARKTKHLTSTERSLLIRELFPCPFTAAVPLDELRLESRGTEAWIRNQRNLSNPAKPSTNSFKLRALPRISMGLRPLTSTPQGFSYIFSF